jgi:hypothetical protein
MVEVTEEQVQAVLDVLSESDSYAIGMYGQSRYFVPFPVTSTGMVEEVTEKVNTGE